MKNLLCKEVLLATPVLTFLFLLFACMTLIPGYPILCGAFFVCFGIFHSYQLGREDNDILFTVLLPVKKAHAVTAKYAMAVLLQMTAFALFTLLTLLRMVFLSQAEVYRTNPLMGANFTFLAFVLLIFLTFNAVFIGGFFKTAHGYGKPFLAFIAACFLLIGLAETLHHLPGLGWLNGLSLSGAMPQIPILLTAAALYWGGTLLSCKASQKRLEQLDL